MLVPKSVHEKHNLSDNCMILCCRSTGLKMVSRSLRGASTTGSAEILMEPAPCTLLQPHWTMTATTPSWQATLRWVEKTMQTPMFDCLSDMSPLIKIMFSGLNGKRGLNETGKPWRGSKVYVEQALELSFPALTLTFISSSQSDLPFLAFYHLISSLSSSLRAGWAALAGWWSRRWTSEVAASAQHLDTCAGEAGSRGREDKQNLRLARVVQAVHHLHVLLCSLTHFRTDSKQSKKLLFKQMFAVSWIPLFGGEKLSVNEREHLLAWLCFSLL